MSDIIITITGPSAAGKSTLEALLVRSPAFSRIRSTTTRARRAGESEDAYYFVSEDAFLNTKMVESVVFSGARYGVSEAEIRIVEDSGRIPVIVCEPQGQEQITRWASDNGKHVLAVFVDGPIELRLDRLIRRFISDRELGKTDFTDQQIARFVHRLSVSVSEECLWGDETWRYSMIVSKFGPENEHQVVLALLKLVADFERAIDAGKDPSMLELVDI